MHTITSKNIGQFPFFKRLVVLDTRRGESHSYSPESPTERPRGIRRVRV